MGAISVDIIKAKGVVVRTLCYHIDMRGKRFTHVCRACEFATRPYTVIIMRVDLSTIGGTHSGQSTPHYCPPHIHLHSPPPVTV